MSLFIAAVVFVAATALVVVAAPRMAGVSDELSSRTQLGSALFGAIFLGASTSLPGIIVTVTAALRGQTSLAAANALGGIAAQTAFLAFADIAHFRGVLPRDAVSRKVMGELALVVGLLALVLVGFGAPNAVVGVHIVTPLLVVAYLGGLAVIRRQPADAENEDGEKDASEASTTDQPRRSADDPNAGSDDERQSGTGQLWRRYAVLAAVLVAAGAALSYAVEPLASALGLNLAAAGAVLTALATSTPELLTALSAARRGALALAVGDIAGGNAFDVLFLFAGDVAALGALYGSLTRSHVLLAGVALLLNAVLLIGFVRRGGRGIRGRVALESALVVAGYVVVVIALLLT